MAGTILILEDDPDRLAELLAVVAQLFPQCTTRVERDCESAIAWLSEHQHEVDLITLDHDLDAVAPKGDRDASDPGCGRGVADFLATMLPTCPVIVHSANEVAGSGMFFELKRAGWPVWRVRPRDHHAWVRSEWRCLAASLVEAGWI